MNPNLYPYLYPYLYLYLYPLKNSGSPCPVRLSAGWLGNGERQLFRENGRAVQFYRRPVPSSPLDNVVGGNTTSYLTTARGAVTSNHAGDGPGFQKREGI